MTAVAVQQSGAHHQQYNPRQSPHSSNMSTPHQSRPQSYISSAARQEAPIQNGTGVLMNPRPAVSNDPVLPVNGHGRAGVITTSSTESVQRSARRGSFSGRPTSAPHGTDGNADSSQDEGTRNRRAVRRRPKSLLQRSKSDYGPGGNDSQTEDEIQDWGARHGFEDHYQSEEFVSQLANVSSYSFYSSLFGVSIGITGNLVHAFPKSGWLTLFQVGHPSHLWTHSSNCSFWL